MSPGKLDPWINGQPLAGITFDYNERVTIASGPFAGRHGWLVSLEPSGDDPVYTVELEEGGPDLEVPQSLLRRTT